MLLRTSRAKRSCSSADRGRKPAGLPGFSFFVPVVKMLLVNSVTLNQASLIHSRVGACWWAWLHRSSVTIGWDCLLALVSLHGPSHQHGGDGGGGGGGLLPHCWPPCLKMQEYKETFTFKQKNVLQILKCGRCVTCVHGKVISWPRFITT